MSTNRELLVELARVRVIFQMRALAAVMGLPAMQNEPDYVAERKLPDGATCADCCHGPVCDGLFGAVRRGFTSCDFWPSRFAPAIGDRSPKGGDGLSGSVHESPGGEANRPKVIAKTTRKQV